MAVNLYAFDLIELDGQDLRRHPWRERRAALAKLIGGAAAGIVLSEHLDGDGAAIFRHACALGLEGIVSKRRDERASAPCVWPWARRRHLSSVSRR
jgi:bifunctional non-homologous end joining protein LigD